MTTVKKTYTLSKIKQLIDLNGDSTNFDITFKVVSKNVQPFDIVVVDQTTLDNSPELQYQKAANGQMSGNIVQDKNVYQNYFLCLRSDQPCECDIEIDKKELPKNNSANLGNAPEDVPNFATPPPPRSSAGSNNSSSWKTWMIIGIVVIGAVILFFVYRSDKNKKKAMSADATEPTASAGPQKLLPSPSPESMVHTSSESMPGSPSGGGGGNDLLQRLKKLHMN